MSGLDDLTKGFARTQALILGVRAKLVKYQALGEGDAATVAGADRAIAQAKFALVDDGRMLGKDRASSVQADSSDGVVSGLASTDDMDLYRHVVTAGAFSQSIRKRGLTGPPAIKLLLDHDWTKIAGVIRRLEYRGGRLEIDAKLNLDIDYVRDRYSAMKMLGGFNFSVGFLLQEYEIKTDANKVEYLQINRGDLFEVSLVAFPGNEAATLTSIKQQSLEGQSPLDPAIAAIQRIQGLLATLR
ncbi:HK97 family phage prohead protease [Mesorhizobium sp. CN2-181]|uniref:HK97 family phage prohead protease n=1 Tax=Mesorhizobium yinganensis TaxID=3157707 RepID=UPI0032B76D39